MFLLCMCFFCKRGNSRSFRFRGKFNFCLWNYLSPFAVSLIFFVLVVVVLLIILTLNFTYNVPVFPHKMMMQRYNTDVWLNFMLYQFISSLFLLKKGTKLRIADFVHGADGLGNQNFDPPKGKPIEQSAAAFLVEQASLHPGEITVVALGPLTNIALVRFLVFWGGSLLQASFNIFPKRSSFVQAIKLDPVFPKNIGQIVLLGGAFGVNGNVNPAAEANVSFSNLCGWFSDVHF